LRANSNVSFASLLLLLDNKRKVETEESNVKKREDLVRSAEKKSYTANTCIEKMKKDILTYLNSRLCQIRIVKCGVGYWTTSRNSNLLDNYYINGLKINELKINEDYKPSVPVPYDNVSKVVILIGEKQYLESSSSNRDAKLTLELALNMLKCYDQLNKLNKLNKLDRTKYLPTKFDAK